MKGISHFVSAIAAATFVPGVVTSAADQQSMLLVLAGIFGLMPDWLDFKLARFFEPADEDIAVDPQNFDAQAMADQITAAIGKAADKDHWIQLHSAPLGPDRWRKYSIQFDSATNEIVIRPGPTIDGASVAVEEAYGFEGRAKAPLPMSYTYAGEMFIESMDGPTFEFRRDGDAIEISFLPWHRRWSHSLVLAAFFAIGCGIAFGVTAGWVVFVAFAIHVLEDQLGHLGSNLWWPFTARRSNGLKLMHSGDAIPNFVTVLMACGLILYNLNRFAAPSLYDGNLFLLWGVVLPAIVGLVFYAASKRPIIVREESERQRDILSETEETQSE